MYFHFIYFISFYLYFLCIFILFYIYLNIILLANTGLVEASWIFLFYPPNKWQTNQHTAPSLAFIQGWKAYIALVNKSLRSWGFSASWGPWNPPNITEVCYRDSREGALNLAPIKRPGASLSDNRCKKIQYDLPIPPT